MRRVFVDASAFITLAGIDRAELLGGIDGDVATPAVVRDEIVDDPARGTLKRAVDDSGRLGLVENPPATDIELAVEQLGRDVSNGALAGDVALLAHALGADDPVVVTDDKPLRKTCKALGIPISGSIGVVIAAVERGYLDPEEAKDALVAMDEVGGRLSARLLRKAERPIDEAAGEREV